MTTRAALTAAYEERIHVLNMQHIDEEQALKKALEAQYKEASREWGEKRLVLRDQRDASSGELSVEQAAELARMKTKRAETLAKIQKLEGFITLASGRMVELSLAKTQAVTTIHDRHEFCKNAIANRSVIVLQINALKAQIGQLYQNKEKVAEREALKEKWQEGYNQAKALESDIAAAEIEVTRLQAEADAADAGLKKEQEICKRGTLKVAPGYLKLKNLDEQIDFAGQPLIHAVELIDSAVKNLQAKYIQVSQTGVEALRKQQHAQIEQCTAEHEAALRRLEKSVVLKRLNLTRLERIARTPSNWDRAMKIAATLQVCRFRFSECTIKTVQNAQRQIAQLQQKVKPAEDELLTLELSLLQTQCHFLTRRLQIKA